MSITLKVVSRSGKLISNVQIDADATVAELKKRFAIINKRGPERQWFTLPPKPGQVKGDVLKDDDKLSAYQLVDGSSVVYKDLGYQVGWTTVFFWEYFGPLFVYPLFYFFPQYFYPSGRYSKGTMPIFNLFKNCTYYWLFGAYVSFSVNHPLYTPPSELQSLVCFGLAMICQFSNLYCHILQRNLRKPGEKDYKIPHGFLFEYVTCANYTTEIYGWILFSIATQTAAAGIFTLAGLYQMTEWALAKHKRLRKMFDGKDKRPKYPRRWVILPPFI